MPFDRAYRATATIIGLGPQVAIRSKCSRCSTECCVTKPFSPSEASSVVIYTSPNALNMSNCIKAPAERPPNKKTGRQPSFTISFPMKSNGAVPTPPPTNSTFSSPDEGIVKPFPKGMTTLSLSPTSMAPKLRVPSPIS